MKIGFIGLGKLGLECAEVMATKHDVIGYDVRKDIESKTIKITNNIDDTVKGKDFTFIAVPTPHAENYDGRFPTTHLPSKDFNYEIVKDVLKEIQHIKSDSVITLISTVLPGTIRREFLEYIEPTRFIYNPYLIAMGTIKHDMEYPEMIIIGAQEIDSQYIEKLKEFYTTFTLGELRFEIGTWDEAEAIKIFYNTFISMKLSFVNMVLDVAEKNKNMNVDTVINALNRSTKRIISTMYMKAGMGDGGPCHPRDNIALSSLSKRLNLGYDLFGEIMKIREKQAENLADKLISFGNPIVILGSSYKPGVQFLDGSYGLLVGYYIQEKSNLKVSYDKEPETKEILTYLLGHMKQFNKYDFRKGSVVVDPWGECSNNDCNVVYYGRKK